MGRQRKWRVVEKAKTPWWEERRGGVERKYSRTKHKTAKEKKPGRGRGVGVRQGEKLFISMTS